MINQLINTYIEACLSPADKPLSTSGSFQADKDKDLEPIAYSLDSADDPNTQTLTVSADVRTIDSILPTMQMDLAFATVHAKEKSSDVIRRAQNKIGKNAFETQVGQMVRQALLTAAQMHAGIVSALPGVPLDEGAITPSQPLVTRMHLYPATNAQLSSYDIPHLESVEQPDVSEEAIRAQMSQMVGGQIPWDDLAARGDEGFTRVHAMVQSQLEAKAHSEQREAVEKYCVDALAARLDAQPTQEDIEVLAQAKEHAFRKSVERSGADWDEYTQGPLFDQEDFARKMHSEAQYEALRDRVADALVKHDQKKITVDDVVTAIKANTMRSHLIERANSRDELLTAALEEGILPQLISSLLRRRALDRLIDAAL